MHRFTNSSVSFTSPASPLALDFARIPLLDRNSAEKLEVSLAWGDTVVALRHVTLGSKFRCGSEASCDFVLPEGVSSDSEELIGCDAIGSIVIRVPQGAEGIYRLGDGTEMRLPDVVPSSRELPFPAGGYIRIELGRFTIGIGAFERPKAMPKAPLGGFDRATFGYFGMTASVFGGWLLALAALVPPLGFGDEMEIQKERNIDLAQYMKALAERQKRIESSPVASGIAESSDGAGKSASAPGAAGKAGTAKPRMPAGRAGLRGDVKSAEYRPSRGEMLEEARNSALIGLLRSSAAGIDSPLFARDTSFGPDDLSTRGTFFGDSIGEVSGTGLALLGDGSGGGDVDAHAWVGVPDGGIETALTSGGCRGVDCRGEVGLPGNHSVRVPRVSMPPTGQVDGTLPAEVIRRAVRQNFARFRFCYERGLARNPELEGRVTMRFVIGRDGSVSNVASAGSDLRDGNVTGCLTQAFYGLSFPAPKDGIVRVTYPLVFSPE